MYVFLYNKFYILAALFFLTYEEIKIIIQPKVSQKYYTVVNMGAATLAEMVLYFKYCYYYIYTD
jgi:hypothetical protein